MDRQSFENLIESGAFGPSNPFVPENQEWEMPIPFNEVNTPAFPVEALPGPLSAFLKSLSESTQTPEEMAGILALGVLATAFQGKFSVEITPDWREPLCLYCVAVAPPGERKSAVISALTRPLYDYEADRRKQEAVEIAQNQTERAVLEKALDSAKNMAARGGEDSAEKREAALEIAAQLAQFEDKQPFRLIVDDTTPEKLVDVMDAQNGCITVCSAEGGLFDTLRGRYERNANFDIYLKGHAGDPIVIDRISRKTNSIPNPRLTMMLTIQPQVLSGLMSNATLRGRGLCGRFLYAVCRSRVGHREISPSPIPESVRSEYSSFVRNALSMQWDGMIHLSRDADAIRKEYQASVEMKLGNEWEGMRDWAGKLTGAMVRIAALIHAAEVQGNPAEIPISPGVMHNATNIAECLSAHAVAAYQIMGADANTDTAKYIWGQIIKMHCPKISKRDLCRAVRGRIKKIEEMEAPLHILEEFGYIRVGIVHRDGPGRKASPLISVNPLAFEG